jgi:hypothetical protein
MPDPTVLTKAGVAFAYVGALLFVVLGMYLSYRRGRPHALLLLRRRTRGGQASDKPKPKPMYDQRS